MHWTRQNSSNSQANALVARVTDPVSGQPALKGSTVMAKAFEAKWYGFLASQAPIVAQSDYCAIARSNAGWTAELAGLNTPKDWLAVLGQLTDVTEAEISVYEDVPSGQTRLAAVVDGCIKALLFVGPGPLGLARRTAANAIGSTQSALMALAGRPASDAPDEGAILCSCFSVGVNVIQRAIDGGAGTVAKIGESTCAGTNCGSCRPELAAMLAAQMPKLAAE
jgi:assimilatory nitrate reductase catalytic subunit